MKLNELIEVLKEDDLSFKLFFTCKERNGNYVSFSPNIDPQIFEDLVILVIDYLSRFIDREVVAYNPTGYKDETIEACEISYINDYSKVIESFKKSDKVGMATLF